jgi:DNA repair ATPase RecN
MPDLTQAEEDFFATGELPPELIPEVMSEVVEPAVTIAPAIVPAIAEPAPQLDMVELLRRSLSEEQQRHAEATARLTALEQQLKEKLQPPIVEPDPETDPLGNMMHKLQQVNENVADLQQKLTQEQQNNILKQQFEQFNSSVQQMKQQFMQTTPDFQEAYVYIRNVRTEDLRSVGISEADIPKILLQDEFNISQAAIQRAKNPAEEMYNMAKRYGYAPKAVVAQPVATQQKMDNLKKGLDAARQPTKAAPESDLTFEGLSDAGEDDLNKIVQDDKLWHKIMGKSSNDIF